MDLKGGDGWKGGEGKKRMGGVGGIIESDNILIIKQPHRSIVPVLHTDP